MSLFLECEQSSRFKLLLSTTHTLCELIDTPRSLAVSLLLQYGDYEGYMDLSIDPSVYEDPRHFALDYLVTEILRKSPYLPLNIDRVKAAKDSFKESEASCRNTNYRLESWHWPEVLHSFQRNMSRVLGPLTDSDLRFVESRFRFGPGATTGVVGQGSVPSDKYDETLHLTADLIPFYKAIVGEQWWEHHRRSITVVDGSKFTTVPKSAKTDRGICIEPTLNMYVQLGIGALIRKRLRRFGLNLDVQAERNRYLASVAHKENLCTIDLSAASDSICTKLIHYFVPERWYSLLALPRSPTTIIDGETIELEKWSSMGNGYTFELETAIFYALCMSVVPPCEMHNVSVFGDDIIIPRQYASALVEALGFLGFRVNRSKSFLAGNFFESCGRDFFKGVPVRPFYLKEESGAKVPFSLQIANKLRAYAFQYGWEISCDPIFKPLWQRLVDVTPRSWRLPVPEHFGDSGIITSLDDIVPERPRDGIEGYVVKHKHVSPSYKRKDTFGVLLFNLAALERRPDSFLERDAVRSFSDMSYHHDNSFRDFSLRSVLFSKGREPKRGLFGRIRTKQTITQCWSNRLSWNTD